MTSHTEEEAKKLWCPMAKTLENAPEGATATNRPFSASNTWDCACIASACAMWQRDGSTTQGTLQAIGHCGLVRP